MVAGEKSSKLPQILNYVTNDAEVALVEGVKRLVILLRSAVILGTGTMVGLLVISYFTVFVSSFVALK